VPLENLEVSERTGRLQTVEIGFTASDLEALEQQSHDRKAGVRLSRGPFLTPPVGLLTCPKCVRKHAFGEAKGSAYDVRSRNEIRDFALARHALKKKTN
jgi:hypothetical protein